MISQISLRAVDEVTGLIIKNNLVAVVDKGIAPVYEITTRAGYIIKATMNHRFMTHHNKWLRLSEFTEGDYIAVNGKEFKTCIDCGKPIDRKAKSRCIVCHNTNQKQDTALSTTMRQRKECVDYRLNYCERCDVTDTRFEVHHIDRNPNNNKLSNLRSVSRKENAENIAVHKDNVSKFKGVTFDKRKSVWFARIMHNKVAYHLGTYKSPEEASLAYIEAANRFHRYNAACTKQGLL
jgi:hypothetical protein